MNIAKSHTLDLGFSVIAAVPAAGALAVVFVALERYVALGQLPQPYVHSHPGSALSWLFLSILGWSMVLLYPAGVSVFAGVAMLVWQRRRRFAALLATAYCAGVVAFFVLARAVPSSFGAWLMD